MGRKTKMTPEVQDEILNRIIEGESLNKILKSDKKFPTYSNFLRFVEDDEIFQKKYARARADQADYLAEEILDIADDKSQDTFLDKEGNEKCDKEWINRSRLRVDARKWIASKLKPKKYGERMQHANDDDNPMNFSLNIIKTYEK